MSTPETPEFIYVLKPARIGMVTHGATDREREVVEARVEYLKTCASGAWCAWPA